MSFTADPAVIVSVLFVGLILFHENDALDRRVSRNSAVVRIASVEMEPYLMPNPDYSNNTNPPRAKFIGYIADLVDKLSHVIGFDYVIYPVADRSFGHKRVDGSWDGIVGELVSGNADLAAAPMYATGQRSQVVDFTDPFMAVYATILIRRPHYTTTMPTITSLKELIRQSDVRYGTLNRGVLVRAFRRTNVTTYRTAWRQMTRFQPSVFTESNDEGIGRLRRPGERYAFILPHPIGDYVAGRPPCDLFTVGRFLAHRGYALAVPLISGRTTEASSLPSIFGSAVVDRAALNAALRTLADTGFIDGLYRKWWTPSSQCLTRTTTIDDENENAGIVVVGPKRQAAAGAAYSIAGSAIKNRAAYQHDTYGDEETWIDGHRPADDGYFAAVARSSSLVCHLYSILLSSIVCRILQWSAQ